jgi:polyisoprenoid-binding protein YceI
MMRSLSKWIVFAVLVIFYSPVLASDTPNTQMVKPTPGIAYWTLDQANSTAIFVVNHSSLLDLYGYIPGSGMSGGAEINDSDFTKSKFEVTFKASSLATTFSFPFDIFKGADGGLDAAKYPEIIFVSKQITKKGDKYLVMGGLTMHGVTKDVIVEIDHASDICLYDGYKYRAFQGKAVVNRQEFGMNWREPEKLNHPLFSDEVRITMILEVVNPAPTPFNPEDAPKAK